MEDRHVLLVVALVALAGLWSVQAPTGALVGMDCIQSISDEGVGMLYCRERAQVDRPGNPQRFAQWRSRPRITREDVNPGIYRGMPTIRREHPGMFSGEAYVRRRQLQRSETFK